MSTVIVAVFGGFLLGCVVHGWMRREDLAELREENVELREANAQLGLEKAGLQHDVTRAREAAYADRERVIEAYLHGYMEGRRDEKADHQ